MNFIHAYLLFEQLNFHGHGGSQALTRWQSGDTRILSFYQTYLDKGFHEIDLASKKLEQLSVTTN